MYSAVVFCWQIETEKLNGKGRKRRLKQEEMEKR